MPTGVPIPQIREQLLDAAERVLLRDPPEAVTSRAVTTEAGVAKGILHRHFRDFDAFLAALVLRYLERLDAQSVELRATAGSGRVEDDLVSALAAALNPAVRRIITLVCCRPPLLERLRLTTPAGIPLLAETTKMIAAYLTAERGLGRIAVTADVDSLAVLLVGGAYLLGSDDDPPADRLHDLVATALQTVASPTRTRSAKA